MYIELFQSVHIYIYTDTHTHIYREMKNHFIYDNFNNVNNFQ